MADGMDGKLQPINSPTAQRMDHDSAMMLHRLLFIWFRD
jgi:hypothetical protein